MIPGLGGWVALESSGHKRERIVVSVVVVVNVARIFSGLKFRDKTTRQPLRGHDSFKTPTFAKV